MSLLLTEPLLSKALRRSHHSSKTICVVLPFEVVGRPVGIARNGTRSFQYINAKWMAKEAPTEEDAVLYMLSKHFYGGTGLITGGETKRQDRLEHFVRQNGCLPSAAGWWWWSEVVSCMYIVRKQPNYRHVMG